MNFKKRISFCLILLPLFLFAKEVKIGYVDVERILTEYQTAKEAKRELEKEIERYQIQTDSLRRVLEEVKIEFESKKLMLSTEGRKSEEERIKMLEKRYNDLVSEVWGERGAIMRKNQELITPIVQKVQAAIEKVAKEENFTIIFDGSQQKILYAEPGLDLTDAVLAELQREAGIIPLAPVVEKRIAIIAFSEDNTEAREEKLGGLCLTYLYQLLQGRKKVKLIEKGEVKRVLSFRKLKESDKIEKDVVYELGQELNTNYAITGQVTKSGRRITVEITYFDIEMRKDFPPEKIEVTRKEELKAKIGDIIKKILKPIVGE